MASPLELALTCGIITKIMMADTSHPFEFPSGSPDDSLYHDSSDDISTPGTSTPPIEQLEPNEYFVNIPDMFTSIMSAEARINPHYAKIKTETDAWIAR